MTRLDIELVNRSIFNTRSKAQSEIKNGIVFCNDKKIIKPSFEVSNTDIIDIRGEVLKYVSRGGLKLEKSLQEFDINMTDKVMLDIGSSTGGFTDCALQNNIKEVIAVDVGSNQMVDKLRKNPQVHIYENCDIRNFESSLLKNVDIITIDISFISVTKILDKIKTINNAREIICLIKPQFECGKELADKYRGIIMDKQVHKKTIVEIIKSFNDINYFLQGLTSSPIRGSSGNIEYLAYFTKNNNNKKYNIDDIINKEFR